MAKLRQLPFVVLLVLWAILTYGSISEGSCAMLALRKVKAVAK